MPNRYSNEYADIHFICGSCNGTSIVAVAEYRWWLPERGIQNSKTSARNCSVSNNF